MAEKKTPNIVMLGTTMVNNNRGCEALALGALTKLCEIYDCDTFTVISGNTPAKREETELIINGKKVRVITKFVDRYTFYWALFVVIFYKLFHITNNDLIRIISKADIVFDINHGDGFTDNYGMPRLIRAFFETVLTSIMKKPLIFLPQTIGPFNTLWGKLMAIIILKGCSKVFVRDNMANDFLHSIGINPIEAYDLSVYMKPEKVDFEVLPNTIGINISGLLHFKTDVTDTAPFEMYDSFIEKLLSSLIEEGYKVLLVPHTYNNTNPDRADDLKACQYFAKKLNSSKIRVVDKDYSAPQLKYIISQCDFFMGSRMHSNFAALSTSTPVIGLSYSYKFEGGFERFGIKDCVINLKNIKSYDIQSIINKILSLIDEKSRIKDILLDINSKSKELDL